MIPPTQRSLTYTSTEQMPLVVELNGIKLVQNNNVILRNVSLCIDKGQHWVILGPNGSGKTALIKVITAYLWPAQGSASVLGDKYGSVDIREKLKQIGIVSSALYDKIPQRDTCLDIILSGRYASLGIFDTINSRDRVDARGIAMSLGCEKIIDRPFGLMSFGERQRTLIGRALMAEPELLILDEPGEGLDLHAREIVLNAIDSIISRPEGPTLIMVTHRVEEIPPGITHTLILKDGRVLFSGLKKAVLNSANLTEAMDCEIEIIRKNGRYYATV